MVEIDGWGNLVISVIEFDLQDFHMNITAERLSIEHCKGVIDGN